MVATEQRPVIGVVTYGVRSDPNPYTLTERHLKLLAVQWHPEESAHADSTEQRLFEWLVRQARGEPPAGP